MQDVNALFLHEQVLLLGLRDREGTAMSSSLDFALAGAILAELLLNGRLAIEPGKKKLVNLLSEAPVGDAVIDELLEQVATAKRRRKLQDWVGRCARIRRLRHRVAEGLCRRRILRAEEGSVLLFFKRQIYPERDPRPERQLLRRLRTLIFSDSRRIDPRLLVLLSLVHSIKLLNKLYDKQDLRRRKQRIKALTRGEIMGQSTREAIEAVQAAQAAAAMVAVTVATSRS